MTTDSEIWRACKTVNGDIEVSNLGRARRIARKLTYSDGRSGMLGAGMLAGFVGGSGYRVISYGYKKHYLHRLVAEEFLPPPADVFAYQTVNHKNGDKLDNRPENLEWATNAANSAHARDTGLNNQHGSNCNLSKFGEQLIAAMKNVNEKYSPSKKELSILFGVSERHVYDVLRGATRKKG